MGWHRGLACWPGAKNPKDHWVDEPGAFVESYVKGIFMLLEVMRVRRKPPLPTHAAPIQRARRPVLTNCSNNYGPWQCPEKLKKPAPPEA